MRRPRPRKSLSARSPGAEAVRSFAGIGGLSGACHRARVRATRWLTRPTDFWNRGRAPMRVMICLRCWPRSLSRSFQGVAAIRAIRWRWRGGQFAYDLPPMFDRITVIARTHSTTAPDGLWIVSRTRGSVGVSSCCDTPRRSVPAGGRTGEGKAGVASRSGVRKEGRSALSRRFAEDPSIEIFIWWR